MTRPYDVISIGGATQDVFVKSDLSQIVTMKDVFSERSLLCFDYGSKINIDKVMFEFGGGGVNSSVNFANFGLKAALMAVVGADQAGNQIIQRLTQKNVHTNFVRQKFDETSGFSVILNSYEGERTVLTYRGANSHIHPPDIDWEALSQTRWVYVSGLSGEAHKVLEPLADFVRKHNIQVAFNPGVTQVQMGLARLQKFLSVVDVLILNKEEALQLTGMKEQFHIVDRDKCTTCGICIDICPPKIFEVKDGKAAFIGDRHTNQCRKSCELCVVHCPERAIFVEPWASNLDGVLMTLKATGPKVVCITDGGHGVQVFDGVYRYLAPSYQVPVESTLGAGDCFASTFVATLMTTDWNIEHAMLRAAANAAHCVQHNGAHIGIQPPAALDAYIDREPEIKVLKKSLQNAEPHTAVAV